MSRLTPRRIRLIVASAAVLALLVGAAAVVDRFARTPSVGPALSVHSTLNDGAAALYLWMAESGYQTAVLEYRPFGIEPGTKLLFLLAPGANLTEAHAAEIVDWVERGGTLVVSTQDNGPLSAKLGVQVKGRDLAMGDLVPLQPIFRDLPVKRVEAKKASTIEPTRPEWMPFLGSEDSDHRVVGVMGRIGKGRAFVLATGAPFANDGLLNADNWALVQYFVASVPAGSRVVFDEYHHGLTEYGTFGMRLRSEPWGWAVLYIGAVLFVFVVLSGRRFGAALRVRPSRSKRSRSEYVSTIAAMLRQGHHRRWLCKEYAAQLRRDLGARYQIPADLPAAEFAAALAQTRPEAVGLTAPMQRLERGAAGRDASVVAAMREAEEVRAQLLGQPNHAPWV